MKISELDLKWITLIQLSIATIVSLIFQFIIPFNWQPLDRYVHGATIKHGDYNYVFFTISQWYFSCSIAWFLYQDNPYLNNFLIYSIISLGSIIFIEFFVFFLFWDYIHLVPFIIDVYILVKKRDTLRKDWFKYLLVFTSTWYYAVYFLRLAYYEELFFNYFIKGTIITVLGYLLTFTFNIKNSKESK